MKEFGYKLTFRSIRDPHTSRRESISATAAVGFARVLETLCGYQSETKKWASCQTRGGGDLRVVSVQSGFAD